MRKYFIFLFFSLIILHCNAQKNPIAREHATLYKEYCNKTLLEKVYLHTDKSIYEIKEPIWFCVYLVDGLWHRPIPASTVYVELISLHDKKIVESRIVKIVEGNGHGDLYLKKELIEGKYLLRAYTKNMKNFDKRYFYHKTLHLRSNIKLEHPEEYTNKDTESIIHADFFPESGHLLSNLNNKVIFRVTDGEGKPINIKGEIHDDLGKKILEFETLEAGLGNFFLVPEKGKRYEALVLYNNETYKFKLPKCKDEGYQMTVVGIPEKISVSAQGSAENKLDHCFITCQGKGELKIFENNSSNNNRFSFSVPREQLPRGLVQFTLFDRQGIPLCERSIFNPEDDPVMIDITVDTAFYKQRSKIAMMLNSNLPDSLINNISISVSKSILSNQQNNQDNIHNYLSLSSELTENIGTVGYYLDRTHPKRLYLLNLLLASGISKNFDWKEELNGQTKKPRYSPEIGCSLSGQLVDYYNRDKPIKGYISLYNLSKTTQLATANTNNDGLFLFNGLELYDTTNLIINAKKINKWNSSSLKSKAIYVKLDEVNNSIPNLEYINSQLSTLNTDKLQNDTTFIYDRSTTLIQAVEVVYKRDNFRREAGVLYSIPFFTVCADSIPNFTNYRTLYDFLIDYFPGRVSVNRNENTGIEVLAIRGDSNIGILMDGVLTPDLSILKTFSMHEIKQIDLLTTAQASIYGYRGVVAIYTRKAGEYSKTINIKDNMGFAAIKHPGFSIPNQFQSPIYEDSKSSEQKIDDRTTLYWNPKLQINETGISEIEIYTGDENTRYTVELEGLTKDGKVITGNASFYVE